MGNKQFVADNCPTDMTFEECEANYMYYYNPERTLPAMGLDLSNGVGISGFSAGCFFSVQMTVISSSRYNKISAHAGGPYGAYWGENLLTYMSDREGFDALTPANEMAQANAEAGVIDPLENLANLKAIISTGSADTIVPPHLAGQIQAFYDQYEADTTLIEYDESPGHVLPSAERIFEQFQTIYGDLNDPDEDWRKNGALIAFDTREFSDYPVEGYPLDYFSDEYNEFQDFDPTELRTVKGFEDEWHIYVPDNCRNGNNECKLHVMIHGCGLTSIYDMYRGYASVASSNNMVLLLGSVVKGARTLNRGCFDVTGYTGSDALTQTGFQPATLNKMVDRLGESMEVGFDFDKRNDFGMFELMNAKWQLFTENIFNALFY